MESIIIGLNIRKNWSPKMGRKKMAVLIDNKQTKHKITLKTVRKKAKAILSALDCPEGDLSILIVDDPQIEILNRQYLHREGPTNVIAFPMREGEFAHINPQLLGDVVISADTAWREGHESQTSLEDRFTQLLVHGILHLLGYDHENSEEEAQDMEEKSKQLLTLLETI